MSETLSTIPTELKITQDPRTDLYAGDALPPYVVERSNSNFTVREFTVQGTVSTTSCRFNIRTPSKETIIDRHMMLEIPFRVQFTGVGGGAGGLFDWDAGIGALRHMPLQNALISNMRVNLNSSTPISREYNRLFDPMSRYIDLSKKKHRFSTSPFYPDTCAQYSDVHAGVNSPLGGFENAVGDSLVPRGSFEYSVVSASATDLTLDFVVREPVCLMAPFSESGMNEPGLFGISDVDIDITFASGQEVARVVSVDAANLGGATINSVTVTPQSAAKVHLYCLSPLCNQRLPDKMVYDYYHLEQYITSGVNVNSGNSGTITSNSQNLSGIPSGFYVFVRKQIGDRNYTDPDFYCVLDQLEVDFGNATALLNSADRRDLFWMANKNGYNGSYQQWLRNGSPLFISVEGGDLGISNNSYLPGMADNIQLKVRAQFTNQSNQNFTPELCIIPVWPGILSITKEGYVSTNSLVVDSKAALMKTDSMSPFLYAERQEAKGMYGGKSGFSKFKKNLKSVVNAIDSKTGRKVAKVAGDIGRMIPIVGDGTVDLLEDLAPGAVKLARHLVGSGICSCQEDAIQMLDGMGVLGAGEKLTAARQKKILEQIRAAHGLPKSGGKMVPRKKLASRLK